MTLSCMDGLINSLPKESLISYDGALVSNILVLMIINCYIHRGFLINTCVRMIISFRQ